MLHVDLDEFIAAVEVQRRPELAGRPVVVGARGDPTERGVVATSSYAAREFGVGSGMPLRTAAKRCPEAVFLAVDKEAYDAASARVFTVLHSFDVPVEVLGWDEAFLAILSDHPEAVASSVQRAVHEATGLHCSIGIGDNKLRAKTATGFAKPRGVARLTSETWMQVMGDKPPDALWGIGRKTANRLATLGVRTVAQLATADATWLAAELGPTMGPWYRRLARGVDSSPVDPTPYVARSHSRESTFQTNLTDWTQVAEETKALARQVIADLLAEGRPAVRVAVKIRYAPFQTHTRSARVDPTMDAEHIADAAVGLLERFDSRRAVRLVGVRAEMAPAADSAAERPAFREAPAGHPAFVDAPPAG